jgi:hypothetical protein
LKFPQINSIFIIFNKVFFDKISQHIYSKKTVFLVLTCSQLESFHPFEDFLKDFWTNWNAVLSDMLAWMLPVAKWNCSWGMGSGLWKREVRQRQQVFCIGCHLWTLPQWEKIKLNKLIFFLKRKEGLP